MHNHSYENEFNLQVNEISFSYERMGTKTRFEKEAKGNSEMAYYNQYQTFAHYCSSPTVFKGTHHKLFSYSTVHLLS